MILTLLPEALSVFYGIEVPRNNLNLGNYKSASKVCRADFDKK